MLKTCQEGERKKTVSSTFLNNLIRKDKAKKLDKKKQRKYKRHRFEFHIIYVSR